MKIQQLYYSGFVIACLVLMPFSASVQANEPTQQTIAALPSGAVNATQGHALLDELKQNLFVLDVRTESEYLAGHIPTATHIPLQKLAENAAMLPNDRPILIVCRTGRRAAEGYALLRNARPDIAQIWYIEATTTYGQNGIYLFK